MAIGYFIRRVILLLLVPTWLNLVRAPAPVAHAALTPVAVGIGCPVAEIIGVHGTGEGPSSTDGADSSEIKATFAALADDEQKLGEHDTRMQYFAYPTVTFAEYLPFNWLKLRTAVHAYAVELESELETLSRSCPATPISLVGYSLGALLIDNMLSSYSGEWKFITAVELYGDPCWYNPHGEYRGLARYAATIGLRLGCFSEGAYPFPLVSSPVPQLAVESLCINGDPVCGQGWPSHDIGGQAISAALCGVDRCPHLIYSAKSASDGANFLTKHAFRQTGGPPGISAPALPSRMTFYSRG
jgi:hypothetical protein